MVVVSSSGVESLISVMRGLFGKDWIRKDWCVQWHALVVVSLNLRFLLQVG